MAETPREERSRHWQDMAKIRSRMDSARRMGNMKGYLYEERLYYDKANRVLSLTKQLNKHITDIHENRSGQRCPDCELREAANSAPYIGGKLNGNPSAHIRRHKWYKFLLSYGCETCKGRGILR